MKTERFSDFAPFVQESEIEKNETQARTQKEIAKRCGFSLKWAVGDLEHKARLLEKGFVPRLADEIIVIPECRRQ